jgi:hypothetical protein
MGIPINSEESHRDSGLKISSANVIWQGSNIPCIDLRSGDKIDNVVNKLAVLVCNINEERVLLSDLDFTGLVEPGEEVPQTMQDLMVLILQKFTSIIIPSNNIVSPSVEEPYELPSELYYLNSTNDPITSLPAREYLLYIAGRYASTFSFVSRINDSNLTRDERINALESQVQSLSTYIVSTPEIYVYVRCTGEGSTPSNVLIQKAFENLESTFCNVYSTLGTTINLNKAILLQTGNLGNLPQLVNPARYMRNLSGFKQTPTTVADSIGNLWLTVTDIRNKFQNYLNSIPENICVLASPEELKVLTTTEFYTTITFEKPSLLNIQNPIGYRVEVYDLSDILLTTPVYSKTINSNLSLITHNIMSENLISGESYRVNVTALYSCGESKPAYITTKIMADMIIYKIKPVYVDLPDQSMKCTSSADVVTSFIYKTKKLTLQSLNIATEASVTNEEVEPIKIVLKFELTRCTEVTYEEVSLYIQPGDNTVDYEFSSEGLTQCLDGSCGAYTKTLFCGISISHPQFRFDTLIDTCETL